MNTRRINIIAVLVMALAALSALVISTSGQAKGKKDVSKQKTQRFEMKAQELEATRGPEKADPNVKSESMENTKSQIFVAPLSRSNSSNTVPGTGLCQVDFDNRTGWIIQLFVDGSFRGTLAPWGDASAFTGAGATVVYARAVFTDGSALNWGPQTYICYPGQRIYFRMNP
ncbi:MAG: hypothetical protein ACKVQW_16515 [Pyrinomonadaceae bacterium]